MVRTKIPQELPDCTLIEALAAKAESRTGIDFDYFGQLEAFRKTVSGEMRHINELFPEYTPHDEQYHLRNLFHVASTVLGQTLIGSMNATELFV